MFHSLPQDYDFRNGNFRLPAHYHYGNHTSVAAVHPPARSLHGGRSPNGHSLAWLLDVPRAAAAPEKQEKHMDWYEQKARSTLESAVEKLATALKDASRSITVHPKPDGTWVTFAASDGKSATLRIETLAENKVGIIGMALRQWCEDRQEEAVTDRIAEEETHEEERASGQFGVGA